MVTAGSCTIAADQAGNANYAAAVQVTKNVAIASTAPGAPTIGTATPGSTVASIGFTPPANTGGIAISNYTATCNPGSKTGTSNASPIVVSMLSDGTPYTCSVTATNATGTSNPSGTVMVTPTATPVAPAFTSASAITFTVGTVGTFNVTATGTPTPVLTHGGTLPGGVTFTDATGVLTGTATLASGNVAVYSLTFTATNGTGSPTQNFTLTVAKANQSILFTGPGAQSFSSALLPISATASSGLAVVFTSTTLSVCTVSGTNVTMLATGTCIIAANQSGNADYNAAPQVTQGFAINQSAQTITFLAQSPVAQPFVPGAVFAINPLATVTSLLALSYSSTTPTVCTVSGTNATIVAVGTCTIAANQPGNANFAPATQVTRNVAINATVPGVPTMVLGTGGNTQASISFVKPAFNGGSVITGYTATCNPGNITASIGESPTPPPIVVGGLTNGTPYTCSVTANNAAGPSVPSATVNVTPVSGNGPALWLMVCNQCHTVTPSMNQLNGAGSTATVINFVRANQTLMAANTLVQNLSNIEIAEIATYIASNVPSIDVVTPKNTGVIVNVSSHISLTNQAWSAFTSAQVATGPSNGMLSAFNGTQVTYTPTPGFVGSDSFTYQGVHAGGISYVGDPRTVTITVTPAAPAITSANMTTGTYGQSFLYAIAGTNTPTSFNATNLPGGVTIDVNTGLISGTPTQTGIFASNISASNAGGTGMLSLGITINPESQVITFGTQPSPVSFSAGGIFAIMPLATGGASGNLISYSSLTPNVCAVAGSNVTMLTAGLCTIAADQPGNANYADAPQVSRSVTITAALPGAPTNVAATAGNQQVTIAFAPPTSNGGSAISSYTVSCNNSAMPATGAGSPIVVANLANGVTYTCSVAATNGAGIGASSTSVVVTPVSLAFTGTVVSRKTHAGVDYDFALDSLVLIDGAIKIEPRAIGAGHRIVFGFTNMVSTAGSAQITDAQGASLGTAPAVASGNNVIVTLANLPDNIRVTVTLSGVNGAVTASAAMGFLVGDFNGTGSVNASDIAAVKARNGAAINVGNNFLYDVNANGSINGIDVSVVKARSGLALP